MADGDSFATFGPTPNIIKELLVEPLSKHSAEQLADSALHVTVNEEIKKVIHAHDSAKLVDSPEKLNIIDFHIIEVNQERALAQVLLPEPSMPSKTMNAGSFFIMLPS